MSNIWFNGEFIEGKLSLDPADRGFTLGDGLFETIAVRGGRPIWLEAHLTRLKNAADELGIAFDVAKAMTIVPLLMQKSVSPYEVMRLTLTRGASGRGLTAEAKEPGVMMSLNPFDYGKQPQSIRLAISKIRRNETAPSSRLKTLSYIDGIAAAREIMNKADDALMLNMAGHVACTTIANVFLLKGDMLITPRDDQGTLLGITRQKLLGCASQLGLKAHQDVVKVDHLFEADAVFLTNSLRLVTAVTELDGRVLNQRSVHEIKTKLETLT